MGKTSLYYVNPSSPKQLGAGARASYFALLLCTLTSTTLFDSESHRSTSSKKKKLPRRVVVGRAAGARLQPDAADRRVPPRSGVLSHAFSTTQAAVTRRHVVCTTSKHTLSACMLRWARPCVRAGRVYVHVTQRPPHAAGHLTARFVLSTVRRLARSFLMRAIEPSRR